MGPDCQGCREVASQLDAIRREIDSRFAGSDRVFEERVRGLSRWIESKLDSMQLAVDKAELQIKEKMFNENNIREELRQQATTFASKEWVDTTLRPLQDKLGTLWDTVNNWQGRVFVTGIVWSLVLLIAAWAMGRIKW